MSDMYLTGPAVSKVVPTLEPGQLSGVVQQPAPATGGSTLWIVRLVAVRPSGRAVLSPAARAGDRHRDSRSGSSS